VDQTLCRSTHPIHPSFLPLSYFVLSFFSLTLSSFSTPQIQYFFSSKNKMKVEKNVEPL
jgi:hypothetical protein